MPPLATPPDTLPAPPSSAWRRGEWYALALLLAGVALLAGLRPDKAIDFRVYWLNARHYFGGTAPMFGPTSGTGWAGGVYRYPPLFLDLFRPWAALPFAVGVLVWAELQVVAGWATTVALARRWQVPSALLLWPGLLLVAPYLIQEVRYGNAQLFVVLLVIWACLWAENRPGAAGVLLGLAAALKVWPLFFLPCLLGLRRWRLAAAMTTATVAWTSLPAFWRGPAAQFTLLLQWLAQERSIAAAATRTVGFWYPGQSLHDVLARYLAVVDYSQLPDASYRQIAWLHLAPAAFQVVWWTLASFLTLALLLLLARRAQANWDTVVGFLFCALLVLQPHVHRIIFVALLWPALWMAAQCLHSRGNRIESALFGLAVTAAALQPLIPGGTRQRLLQVYGADFWLVLLPLGVATGLRIWQSAPQAIAAKANSG